MLRFSFIAFFFLLFSCDKRDTGTLRVNAMQEGEYEIYKILGDATLQFVSVQIGHLNQNLSLQVGSYLLLGDCSYQIVLIHPNRTTELIAHSVKFQPPLSPELNDSFSIQCNRYPQTHPPQNINHRFELTIFPGSIDMLVGMRPFKINLTPQNFQTPQNLSFNLSALRVAAPPKEFNIEVPPYFTSPADSKLAITQPQELGKWQFLLPGHYTVTVNATQREVEIKEKEFISLDPAYLKFASSPTIQMNNYQAIKGEPYTVEINDQRAFDINTVYPLISDTINYRLEGANSVENLTLKPGILTTITLRSVEVSLNCAPWEWDCLGKQEVNLFENGASSAFMHGSTNLPILFTKDSVQIEIEGTQNLRYKVPPGKRDSYFETGELLLKPKPSYKPGQISLLVRVEGDNPNVAGQSYDIPFGRETRMNLIAGTYTLNHFYTTGLHSSNGGTQTGLRTSILVKKDEVREVSFEYYLPEDKYEAYTQSLGNLRTRSALKEKPFSIF